MDAEGATRRARRKRTAKSCGSGAAVLALSFARSKFAGDGGKRAVLRGEHEVSRKAIAQGRPECSRCTCMLVCTFCLRKSHARPRVQQAPGLPCALYFRRANEDANLGRLRRENAKAYSVRTHGERSEQSMSRHRDRDGCSLRSIDWLAENSAHKSCRVSLPCGTAGRAGAFFAGVSPPVSAITETETTRSMIASTSLRSHCPSDNLVSRSFSRMV